MGGDLDGKWCVVTGGSAGIGKEIARGLLGRGAHVVLISSNPAKGAEALAELKRAAPSCELRYLAADLSSMKDTRRLAAELKQLPRLDVLVHNAAIIPATRRLVEGVESALAVNAIAPFILTEALLELLKRSAPSRVIELVGDSVAVDFDDLQLERGVFNGWHAYRRSKFAGLLYMTDLAPRLAGTHVTINAAFPGFVNTGGMDAAQANMPGAGKLFVRLMRPFMRTPAKGAEAAVYVATAPELAGVSGKMFSIGKPFKTRIKGWDEPAAARRMVEVLAALTASPSR